MSCSKVCKCIEWNLLDLHTSLTLKYPLLHSQLPSVQISTVAVQFSVTMQLSPKVAPITEKMHNQDTIYKIINDWNKILVYIVTYIHYIYIYICICIYWLLDYIINRSYLLMNCFSNHFITNRSVPTTWL